MAFFKFFNRFVSLFVFFSRFFLLRQFGWRVTANLDRILNIERGTRTSSVQRKWLAWSCLSMLYNRINQFLDRFNVTLNPDGGSHNWTEFDAFNEFNENITLSHIINFFAQNNSLDVGTDMLNMTDKFRQLDESIGATLRLGLNSSADFGAFGHNVTGIGAIGGAAAKSDSDAEPLFVLISVTICYLFIFVAGVLGNVITCTVISRNKSMHTATNYYLFNLAISDLILLLSGKSMHSICPYIPYPYPYPYPPPFITMNQFGTVHCFDPFAYISFDANLAPHSIVRQSNPINQHVHTLTL